MVFDVDSVRAAFPALSDGTAYFDGPGGSQTPRVVADAIASALCAGLANRGAITAAERRADDVVTAARAAIADLTGGSAGGVIFGRSMTQLTFDLARAFARDWRTDDEVIVTRLDHDANIRPWTIAAAERGVVVRWAEFDRSSGEQPADSVTKLINTRTRLIAVTGASNLIGTRPDVATLGAAAHQVGAVVYVDGVHLTPHAPVDIAALGADVFVCSPYKFFGPHLGCAVAAPDLLETLQPDKLVPASNAVPERFELGTLPYELLAGVTATVDFIAGMASGPTQASRRDRIMASMTAIEAYEETLLQALVSGLASVSSVTLHASPARRTPTVLFSIAGVPSRRVHEELAHRGVNAPASNFYAYEASHWIGLGDAGAVRAGIAPYTNDEDVSRLIDGVEKITAIP